MICSVDVCDTPTDYDPTVCDRCADMSWNHGPSDDQGRRLCDGCGVVLDDANLAGVIGGEGSADWLCETCFSVIVTPGGDD